MRLQKRVSTWGLCRPCVGGVAAGHSHSDPCRRRGGGTVVHRTTAPSHVSSAPGEARREVGDEGSSCIREPTSSLSPELQASLPSRQLLVEEDRAQPLGLGAEVERESRGYQRASAAQRRRSDRVRVSRERWTEIKSPGSDCRWARGGSLRADGGGGGGRSRQRSAGDRPGVAQATEVAGERGGVDRVRSLSGSPNHSVDWTSGVGPVSRLTGGTNPKL